MTSAVKNNLIIELHVPDFSIAKEFYSKLGFQVVAEDPAAEEPGYMTMKREDALGYTMINFYGGDGRVFEQRYFKRFSPDTKRGYAVEITIPTNDIVDFYNQVSPLVKENLMQELKDKRDRTVAWRDFRLEDPFGFYIRFSENIDWGQ